MSRMDYGRASGLLMAILALLAANVARADADQPAIKPDLIKQQLIKIDQSVHIMSLEFKTAHRETDALADRSVLEAQQLLARGRTDEATTLLLDVISQWPRTLAAHDATFLLGDALFQLRDFLSARTYYEQAIAAWSGTRREQRAVGRLIEIVLRTGDFEPVDRYLALLGTVPTLALDPSAAYVKAKLAYHRGNVQEATRLFAEISRASAFSWQARYFIGAISVKQGDLKGAAAAFEAVVQDTAADDDAREIQDLARLALGRICYQQEHLACARAHYQAALERQPHPKAKVVADALYELGFTYVRSKDLDHAREAFERLVVADPTGARVFETRLLLGSLQLHHGDLESARRTFASTNAVLSPSYDRLVETLARIKIDPAFRDSLGGQSLDQLALSAFVSPALQNWARTDPEVERMLALSADVASTRQGVAEINLTLRRIEETVATADRQMLFPDLTRARSAVTEVSERLSALRRPLVAPEGRLVQASLRESRPARINHNGTGQDGDLDDVLSRADATEQQLRALDGRIHAEGDLRLAAVKDFVTARRREVAAVDDRLTVVVGDARDLGGDLVRALCTRLSARLYELIVRADVGLIDVAWAVSKRSTGVVHADLVKKNSELQLLDADRTRQEAALTRRYVAQEQWALDVQSRLSRLPAHAPLPPLPPIPPLSSRSKSADH